MNKENNRPAAGLRRSVIAERIRLREEWSALKEIDSQPTRPLLNKKQINAKGSKLPVKVPKQIKENRPPNSFQMGRLNRQSNCRSPPDALRGVVALVEVGSECRALPLRAALSALGASVMPAWSPLITHLVWAQGGCRSTRARARALASSLVSPLWVEACAAAAARLPERSFPAAPRPSDLPSPATLRIALKRAEAENISLFTLDNSDENEKLPRLRISSETEHDTSMDTSKDTSRDTSRDTSGDTSKDTTRDATKDTTTDIESRVNTAPRRALPKVSESVSPRPGRSKRKLFTHKEAEMNGCTNDQEENHRPLIPKPTHPSPRKVTKKPECERMELARAERIAKKILASCTRGASQKTSAEQLPRIVLTGMSRTERREVLAAISTLKGRVQRAVNKRTTHVILGSFQARDGDRGVPECSGIINISEEVPCRVQRNDAQQARTLSALCGAARGCRVLRAAWAADSARAGRWLRHAGYEVPHLKKMAQKARVERTALGKTRCEYAYDIFCGMRVLVTSAAEQRDAAAELLHLCGAVVINQDGGNQHGVTQHGGNQHGVTQRGGNQHGVTQRGGVQRGGMQHGQGLTQLEKLLGNTQRTKPTQRTQHALVTQNGEIRYGLVEKNNEFDIKIGVDNGEVASKWVFDSVASGRMRTTRRYVVREWSREVEEVLANFCIDDC